MAQSGKGSWVLFSQHDRSPVNIHSEDPPLPYGTGNPKRLYETVSGLERITRVLDLGCSAACWSPIFENLEYYGLDQDPEIFKRARENKSDGCFVTGIGEDIPFKDGFFDLVFTSHVLQHNDHYPEKDKIVEEISRVLSPLGYYLMVESTPKEWEVSSQDQTFSKQGWVSFLTARGFEFLQYWEPEEYLFRKNT